MQTGATASLRFEVSEADTARALGTGAPLGTGEVTRAVVDRERFLARLG